MKKQFFETLAAQQDELKRNGLYKTERELASPQQARVTLGNGKEVINLCANNYLGLANHPAIRSAAKKGIDQYGFGLSSVRFICGTQTIHHELEHRVAHFFGAEDSILYSSCWDANGGLFETLFGAEDAIISDSLNHASIIDGIRLCKATRFRYQNNEMVDLEKQLQAAASARFRLIATDGVFSMDGTIANLPAICDLADRYDALVMVDDSHAAGFIGREGKGTPEYHKVEKRIDFLTGTFGKALGGASGGYTCGKKEAIEWLRQRSRPYLFSNTLPPPIVAATLQALDLLQNGAELRQRLADNSRYFRQQMEQNGFRLVPGEHPIIPVMLEDAQLAQDFAAEMLEQGVYVIGFSYPVVPQGKARIRTQMSAVHQKEELDLAIKAFIAVGKKLNVI